MVVARHSGRANYIAAPSATFLSIQRQLLKGGHVRHGKKIGFSVGREFDQTAHDSSLINRTVTGCGGFYSVTALKDTRQHKHIAWETEQQLAEQLHLFVTAIIGTGSAT
jgi:hypothetical protein